MWLENFICIGRFEVYIWGFEYVVKFCMGLIFVFYEYIMSWVVRNYVVCIVVMFIIYGKLNGIVMEWGKFVNLVMCDLK